MNAMQLFPNTTLVPWTTLFFVSFPSTYRNLSYDVICDRSYMGILIMSLYLVERCVGERIVHVSLNLDDAIVEDRLFNV